MDSRQRRRASGDLNPLWLILGSMGCFLCTALFVLLVVWLAGGFTLHSHPGYGLHVHAGDDDDDSHASSTLFAAYHTHPSRPVLPLSYCTSSEIAALPESDISLCERQVCFMIDGVAYPLLTRAPVGTPCDESGSTCNDMGICSAPIV